MKKVCTHVYRNLEKKKVHTTLIPTRYYAVFNNVGTKTDWWPAYPTKEKKTTKKDLKRTERLMAKVYRLTR